MASLRQKLPINMLENVSHEIQPSNRCIIMALAQILVHAWSWIGYNDESNTKS